MAKPFVSLADTVHTQSMQMDQFGQRLMDVSQAGSVRQIAINADVEYGRLVRQFRGDHGWSIDMVIALCKAYNIRVADAMHDVGWIDDEMRDRMSVPISLRAYSDQDLLEEVSRRLTAGEMKDGPANV